jgi:hypothetical protein
VTYSAIRIILVTLDPSADPTRVPVTFRILKTLPITDRMTQDEWNQLVFLAMNRGLDVGEPGREGRPEGEPTMALRTFGGRKAMDQREVSEDMGFSPRSSGGDRIFSLPLSEEESSSSDTSGSSPRSESEGFPRRV